MLVTGGDVQEVIVGAVTDQTFGKIVAFGLGGVLVEVLKDVTFRLAPTSPDEARSMIEGIGAHEMLNGVRGAKPVDKEAIAQIITKLSDLVEDFPQFAEVDLNPVLAGPDGATAVDFRIIVDAEAGKPVERYTQEQIQTAMTRIMKPRAVAVIGASNEDGKIGNSVMKNLVNGGYKGDIYPVNPKAGEVLGLKAFPSITDIPGDVDVAVFAVPAKFVGGALEQCGEKGVAGAILIPSGFAETGEQELQDEVVAIAKKHGVRILGPNIYGYYYLPENLCATFCTPYDVKGSVALSSQSGGIGMAILGFSRSSRMGVSAIVGVGNKADIDEDDLLTFFETDDNTNLIAMHLEDLKDGRAFAETAARVSKKKPVIVLKAGRTDMGARAASSHTGALAGNDKVYDDILRQSGVVRAPGLNEMLQYARGIPLLPTPKGENVVIITGAGGSGVLLSDACVDNGLQLMDDAGRPGRGVQEVHPAVRCLRQPGRHHRRRAAVDVPEHGRARPGGRPDPRADPGLLAHDRDPADGVREAGRRGGRGVPRQGHRQARGRLAVRRRRGRGGQPVPVRARDRRLPLHHRDAGRGARRQVPLGPQRGPLAADYVAATATADVGSR